MSQTTQRRDARAGRLRWSRLGLGVLLAAAGACNTDKLVNIENPDVIPQPVVADPNNINEFRNGVFFEFARALTGPAANNATPGIIGLSAVMTDEMWYASTFTTMRQIDQRIVDVNNSDLLRGYQYLHRARNLAEQAVLQYGNTPQKNTADHALMSNLAWFTYVFFAENFCSGVPFSVTDINNVMSFGPALTTAQTLDSAIKRFEGALALAPAGTAGASQRNLAHLGKARALLDKDDYAGAAAEAALVADGFEYDVEYSGNSSGQQNGVWYNNHSEGRTSAATLEGTNGLDYFVRSTAGNNTTDPRTPAEYGGTGTGTTTARYLQLKYDNGDAPVPLGTTTEARLIQAEALLAKGQSNAYLPMINALRASAGLTALADPGTPDLRVRQFFRERAFWLWMTAHRLGDLRRLVRSYGYTQAQVFPVGTTIRGTAYGSDVNFPIPFQEQNNPEFANGQCINRLP